MMHGTEKWDSVIVARKPANKAQQSTVASIAVERSAAEPVERRAGTKGNAGQQSTCRTQRRISVSQALERIRKAARERKKERFTALFHHVTPELMKLVARAFSGSLRPGDPDQREMLGQHPCAQQIVERRYHQPPLVRSPVAPKITMAQGSAGSARRRGGHATSCVVCGVRVGRLSDMALLGCVPRHRVTLRILWLWLGGQSDPDPRHGRRSPKRRAESILSPKGCSCRDWNGRRAPP